MERVYHALHGERDGVAVGEGVVLEQRVEHRLGHQVLGEHPDSLVFAHAVVQVAPQSREESVESRADAGAGRRQQRADSRLVTLRYLPNLVSPLLPVARIGVFVHHHRQDGVSELRRAADDERQLELFGLIAIAARAAADVRPARMPRLRFRRLVRDQFQLVYLRLESVVVRGDCVDDLPYRLVRADVHRVLRRRAGRAGYGQDDIPEALARRLPHHPAHRLHYVYLRAARLQKHDGVQRGDVYALRKASGVGQDARAPLVRVLPQPRQTLGARHRVLRSVHVPNLAAELPVAVAALFFVRRYAAFDYAREVLRERFGLRYRVAERHRPLGGEKVVRKVHPRRAALAKPVPTPDHPRAVVHVQLGLGIRQNLVQIHPDLLQVDVEYQDLVIRQDAHFYGFAESETVELRTEHALVIHGFDIHAGFVRLALDLVAVDARGGGHVQPLFGGDEAVVVDALKVGLGFACERRAGGSVRLVADNQVELRQPHPLRGGHGVQRLVRGEYHRHGGAALGCVSKPPRERGGVGGRGQRQVERRDVVIVVPQPARAGVGAYGERLERNRRVVRPVPKRLRQQRYGWREEQDAAARARDPLRYAKRGERLAGAASHDELAALTLGEAGERVVERKPLILAQALSRLSAQRPRTREAEVFPAYGRILEHVRTPADDGLAASIAKGALGVSSPLGGRGDEYAAGELVGGVGGEELVELFERDGRVGRVELALNGDQPAAVALPRHDVYAGVLTTVSVGILRPQPRPVEPPRLRLVHLNERLDQRLEHAPLLGLAPGLGRQDAENVLKRIRRLMLVFGEEFRRQSVLRVVQVHRFTSTRAA